MTEEYAEYLQSEAWQAKRAQRLAISKWRCSACSNKKAIHVHHLTYERIFNEDMADLMPLCEDHHKIAEDLIAKGKLARRGDVLFLAAETLRLVLIEQPEKKFKPYKDCRNSTQTMLMNNPQFRELLYIPSRRQFKKAVRKLFGRNRGKVMANAFVLYDRAKNQGCYTPPRSYSISISEGRPSQNGFKQPARKWLPVSEAERHRMAYDRLP